MSLAKAIKATVSGKSNPYDFVPSEENGTKGCVYAIYAKDIEGYEEDESS